MVVWYTDGGSLSLSINIDKIVILIKVRFGFEEQLEEFFGVPFFKINNIIEEIASSNRRIFIFIDGLDEAESDVIARIMFFVLSLSKKRNIGIFISCRYSDWIHRRDIHSFAEQLSESIFALEKKEILASVILEEFTDNELQLAIDRYDVPLHRDFQLYKRAKKPFILKIIAEFYLRHRKLPELTDKEFINEILNRLGLKQEPSTVRWKI